MGRKAVEAAKSMMMNPIQYDDAFNNTPPLVNKHDNAEI